MATLQDILSGNFPAARRYAEGYAQMPSYLQDPYLGLSTSNIGKVTKGLLSEEVPKNLTYHVSPVKLDIKNKWGSGYDELYDLAQNAQDPKEYERLQNLLKWYEKGMGNVSGKKPNELYVSSMPEGWKQMQQDELGINYNLGGYYGLLTNKPVNEKLVPAGMGYELPEGIISTSDIKKVIGPFSTKEQLDSELIKQNIIKLKKK